MALLLAVLALHLPVWADVEEEKGPRPGLIGLEPLAEPLDQEASAQFQRETIAETYRKAALDRVKLIALAVSMAILLLAFSRGSRPRLRRFTERLRGLLDWYTLGTITGLLLLGLIIPSGIVIGFFYNATPEGAYASVALIASSAFLGFLRNLHLWASEAFLFVMFLHVARVVSMRTYLGKRKIIWITGAVMLITGWTSFLVGTFLKADQEGFEGFVHLMEAFRLAPLGSLIDDFFSGPQTVMKLYIFHIALTTIAILVLIAPHVLLRKVHVHVTRRWKAGIKYAAVLTGVLVILSVLVPAPFLGKPYYGIEITKPPWPYYFLVSAENLFGTTSMVWAPLAVFVPLFLLPYLVDWLPRLSRKRAQLIGEVIFYIGVALLIGLSYWVAATGLVAHIF